MCKQIHLYIPAGTFIQNCLKLWSLLLRFWNKHIQSPLSLEQLGQGGGHSSAGISVIWNGQPSLPLKLFPYFVANVGNITKVSYKRDPRTPLQVPSKPTEQCNFVQYELSHSHKCHLSLSCHLTCFTGENSQYTEAVNHVLQTELLSVLDIRHRSEVHWIKHYINGNNILRS